MFFKFLIPLIAMILLRNTSLLSEMSEGVVVEFNKDYQVLLCARRDVYRRNVEEALDLFSGNYSYVDPQRSADDFIDFDDEVGDCTEENFAVYRENNPELPAVYPNWVYRETERGD